MNKMWVWVGFPIGIGVVMLLLVFMGQAGAGGIQYKNVETPGGVEKLGYIDKHIGTGEEVKNNDTVVVFYTGKFKNGKEFDSNKKGFQFRVGARKVVPGFDAGVIGMKKGGIRELIIPPELGYGAQGIPNAIPPNAELHFEIELVQIQGPMRLPPGHQPIPEPEDDVP